MKLAQLAPAAVAATVVVMAAGPAIAAAPTDWHINSTPTVTTANQFNDGVPAVTPANFHVTASPAITLAAGFQKC
ncbi:hypothetical protein ABZ468_41990 [Streptomyces sp. NPDC005708]|uniref:hypothetical protein n=1 Tax=Streptomyces sp. NPDC005708 TaxID=3154564 RepID=UPI0033F53152